LDAHLGVDPSSVLVGIAAVVKRPRHLVGLARIDFAKKVGVHPNVIGRLERGAYNPSVMILHGIGAALRISISDLMKWTTKGLMFAYAVAIVVSRHRLL
jgi:DNA-binding XRE family transcriptional regulator